VAAIADSLASASQELAAASEELSSGAQEQASSLEETASSLEEITGTIQQNADNAQQANQLAGTSREVAEKGGEVVGRAVQSMNEINAASKKIADIITAIDEIAFQTNLLALNAAVEAARAGEQGRGFAVVAGEVRNLAQRAAAAAKEIKGLIQDSVAKVEAGTKLVNQSGHTLDEIVTSVKRVTDIVSEIAAASREQAGGIEQVNKAVTQMDQVTQANASQTEELSGTAEGLAGQAAQLQQLVAQFNLTTKRSAGPVAASHHGKSAVHAKKPTAKAATVRTAAVKSKGHHDDSLESNVERELDLLGVGAGKSNKQDGFEEF
jgi:methyl-accepting chemotaxis protein